MWVDCLVPHSIRVARLTVALASVLIWNGQGPLCMSVSFRQIAYWCILLCNNVFVCCCFHDSGSPVVRWVWCLSPALTGSVGCECLGVGHLSVVVLGFVYSVGGGGSQPMGGKGARVSFSSLSGGVPVVPHLGLGMGGSGLADVWWVLFGTPFW